MLMASDEANDLGQQALQSNMTEAIEVFGQKLSTLAERVNTTWSLDQNRREVTQKAIDETTARMEAVRQELAGLLQRPTNQVLCEPQANPAEILQKAVEHRGPPLRDVDLSHGG